MKDRITAIDLDIYEQSKTLESLIETARAEGFKGDQVWQNILESSIRSSTSVDKSFDLERN